MTTRTFLTTLVGVALTGATALTGCSGTPDEAADPAPSDGGDSDTAAAFLACLTSAGVEAKINDSGQVLIKQPIETDDGVMSMSSDDQGLLGMEIDDSGDTWVVPVSADYLQDDPDAQEAYAACENEHADFSQPHADPLADDPGLEADQQEQEIAALAFAQCARDNGSAQFEDPDFSQANALMLPEAMTEAEFRALLEACWEEGGPVFNVGQTPDAPFEAWAVLDEFLQSTTS